MRTMRPRLSFADLERMPEDGRRYELYDGDLSEVPAPSLRHQRIVMHLLEALREHERRAGGLVCLSPVDIVLDAHNVVQPDLSWFAPERAARIDSRQPVRLAPDLVVEVLSPGSEAIDRGPKLQLFARSGVPEFWIVDPERETIEVHVVAGGGYERAAICRRDEILTSRTVPLLTFPVARAFEP